MTTKTLKTNLGIEYDIEIVEIGVKNIVVNVTCEEGSKEFLLTYDFPLKEDNAFYGQVINNDCTQITNDDLVEAEKWVNETTVVYICSEIAKICIRKSNNIDYWTFTTFINNCLTMNVYHQRIDKHFEVEKNYFVSGEEEIKELINKLK